MCMCMHASHPSREAVFEAQPHHESTTVQYVGQSSTYVEALAIIQQDSVLPKVFILVRLKKFKCH
jgi:hypothetical protein